MEIGLMTRARRIIWNGTPDEALSLLHAVNEHCACTTVAGKKVAACAGHTMLTFDQRAVDGLVFMRRIAQRLLAEEFDAASNSTESMSGVR
jgi:hypothetical protein